MIDKPWKFWVMVVSVLVVFFGTIFLKTKAQVNVCRTYYPEISVLDCWMSEREKPAAKERK